MGAAIVVLADRGTALDAAMSDALPESRRYSDKLFGAFAGGYRCLVSPPGALDRLPRGWPR